MAELADIVVDCRKPSALARFWADALDGYNVAPYDHQELRRLAENGIDDPEDDPTVLVEPDGVGPRLWFQLVPEQKITKNRLHLDLRVNDRRAEAARLVSLGATVVPSQPNPDLTTMLDPEGNEFCLIDG